MLVTGRFDADPDPDPVPNFHFDADPDPNLHQMVADPHADLSPNFIHGGKSEFFLLLVTTLPVNNVVSFSPLSKV
jgi:hypothetical protein